MTIFALQVVFDEREKRLDRSAAELRPREAIVMPWTLLGSLRRLSDKSAMATIATLPVAWDISLVRDAMLCANVTASDLVAQPRPDSPLCTSEPAGRMKTLANAGVGRWRTVRSLHADFS